MGEEEYVFDGKPKKVSKVRGFTDFLWNGETKEFCGRDGASWAKVSFFYAIFYTCLGSFFVGMLAVFVQIMPIDKPTYYGETSIMNSRTSVLNPGLGFRPQIDVEDNLVIYDPSVGEDEKVGFNKFFTNLDNFLMAKYPKQEEGDDLIDCNDGDEELVAKLEAGASCRFDHEEIYKESPCNRESKYGFNTPKACFLIKLNKIVSWLPDANSSYVEIKCAGEYSGDQDNIKKVIYHNENDLNNESVGKLPIRYYPFFAQKQYRAPFIWVQFELNTNSLVNIQCKGYANNIDNEDRMNRRGQTKFGLFVSTKEKAV